MIYLDHAATTPLATQAADAMARASALAWGNPSSVHAAGRTARAALEQARATLASVLNAGDARLVFTASASEANNLALKGTVLARRSTPTHLVVSAIEHESVLTTARYLAATLPHVMLTEVTPGTDGIVTRDAIAAALRPESALIALMHANNETGMIQPIEAVAELARERGIPLLCDAVQSFGKIPVDFTELGCDFLTLSAHKFHGPRGAGLLLARRGAAFDALVHGGLQEGGLRAGTENLPAIAGMAAAAELAVAQAAIEARHLMQLERQFLGQLDVAGQAYLLNGAPGPRLPGVINLSLPDLSQDDLIIGMDVAGFAISAGSACSSGVVEPSHVLEAMGLPDWRVRGSVRFSFGRGNTQDEIEAAARAFCELASRLEGALPSAAGGAG